MSSGGISEIEVSSKTAGTRLQMWFQHETHVDTLNEGLRYGCKDEEAQSVAKKHAEVAGLGKKD